MTQNTTSMNMDCNKSVKVDVICGFKGAGKTTLIKRLAEEIWEGERVVFLQNEFGKENLSQMSLQPGWYVKDVQTGCICCNGARLLAQIFLEIIEAYRPDRIVLEATETARMESLRMLLAQDSNATYALEHVLYVCNAKTFSKKMLISGRFLENELKQIPVIVLNHVEELSLEKRNEILNVLQGINAESTIIQKDWKLMSSEDLQYAYEKGRSVSAPERKRRMHTFSQFAYKE